ncbi:MAG TPA: hypothetical protein VK607_03840 [Kofleriaceae bacterium]|nr:hypothetical protein [Kofleriaceae bacterium]
MIESFVDLTYRGLSLGRRIRLSQVRPSTGYLELPAPMPVGAQIAIVADDGTAFDATVTGVHEQVAGSDRAPGMIVAPALAGEPAGAWWKARVTLPDDDALRPRSITAGGRSRPATVRPRSHTDPMPVGSGAAPGDRAAIAADLDARVAAAAGIAAPRTAVNVHDAPTVVMAALDLASAGGDPGAAAGDDPATTLTMPRAGEPAEHDIVDDGNRTVLMDTIDPAALGADLGALAAAGHATATATAAPADAVPGDAAADDDDDLDVTDPGRPDFQDGDDADVTDPDAGDPPADTLHDPPTAQPGGGRRKRRLRR